MAARHFVQFPDCRPRHDSHHADVVLLSGADGTVHNQKQLKPLRYLDWCLSETLRLYPAVPTEGRLCIKETRLPSGYTIPANTFTSVSSYLMHRRADYFPDPLAFKPERWAEHPPHSYAFIAFYGGPQVCLGQNL